MLTRITVWILHCRTRGWRASPDLVCLINDLCPAGPEKTVYGARVPDAGAAFFTVARRPDQCRAGDGPRMHQRHRYARCSASVALSLTYPAGTARFSPLLYQLPALAHVIAMHCDHEGPANSEGCRQVDDRDIYTERRNYQPTVKITAHSACASPWLPRAGETHWREPNISRRAAMRWR